MEGKYQPTRMGDQSFGGTCPSCGSSIPRCVRLAGVAEERTVDIKCPCGFMVSYIGRGLIHDRRRSLPRHAEAPTLKLRLA